MLENAAYAWVSVVARIRPKPRANRTRLAARAVDAIYRYIHPTTGGPDFQGWPFGRELFAGEIYSLLQTVDGLDFIEEVVLHQVDPRTRDFGPPLTRIAPPNAGLLCSYEHRVRVE